MSDITKSDIVAALRRLGIAAGDVVMVHSSMKSFGRVEGGAQTIIDAFEEVLTREGTLAMPTLCQGSVVRAYGDWYMDKPSDVGYLTEYFRKQMYVYRSDHPTHSAAARGKRAYELTREHAKFGPRICPFGEYALADSSPWRKLPQWGGKIVLLGVGTDVNTMKHVLEGNVCEYVLSRIKDPARAAEQKAKLWTSGHDDMVDTWAWFSTDKMAEIFRAEGLLAETDCGSCHIICMDAKTFLDRGFEILTAAPEQWFGEEFLAWYRECSALWDRD
jgi:aminoglycoside 3-N-acetyltransferase